MKTYKILIISIALIFWYSGNCRAQIPLDTTTYRIETNDGNEYIGKILSKDSLKIRFKTEMLDEINIKHKYIIKMNPVKYSKVKDGNYWAENVQSTRYFWSPNGYGLNKGEGYYQNVWVMFNQVAYGVTKNFSFGGGIIPIFLFGADATPVWITPKFSFPVVKNKLNLGGGGLIGTVIGQDSTSFGILYGIATYGSVDRNFSLGIGYGYAGHKFADRPIINLNAMIRIGPKGYLLTENYYIRAGDTTVGVISIGGRRIIRRVGLDFGLFIPVGSFIEKTVAIPWLGLTMPF